MQCPSMQRTILFLIVAIVLGRAITRFEKSPFNQDLPDCTKVENKVDVKKLTTRSGILCPLVRNEVGFLSEWVAFYEIQGFTKIILYDDNSTTSFDEIKPWLDNGFVEIRRNWYRKRKIRLLDNELFYNSIKRVDFLNFLAILDCKDTAIRENIDYFISLDIDEYLIPRKPDQVIIDDISDWFDNQDKGLMHLHKYNFNAIPHIHEPINLLTIEAYQTRYNVLRKMNFYITTAPKIALRLKSASYTDRTHIFLIYCCHFHGCFQQSLTLLVDDIDCAHYASEMQYIWSKGNGTSGQKRRRWSEPPTINHYARSLEKFALKQESWDELAFNTRVHAFIKEHAIRGDFIRTNLSIRVVVQNLLGLDLLIDEERSDHRAFRLERATVISNSSLGNAQGLSLYNYMNRAYGSVYDDRALPWSCQLRRALELRTGEKHYLRPGDFWYRNPEFGRVVTDQRKRGRGGRGFKVKIRSREWNPYPLGETYQSAHKVFEEE